MLNLPPHSAAAVSGELVAEFVVEVGEQLDGIRVVLDEESAPRGVRVRWDGVEVVGRREAVFDADNTTYLLPGLTRGKHVLRVEGEVLRGDDGLLEAPILVGRFRLDDGQLRRLPDEPTEWEIGTPWPELGMPHGFGPVEYVFRYDVPTEGAARIVLPECTGVAEVTFDGVSLGRRSWEPRDLDLGHVTRGEHEVKVVLHGSWNNVFSRLNTVTNGLLGPVELLISAAS
ncbi:hypothetical protein [Kribbella sp.]|uniref:hypothetical protein n=1 Tax=Kribbella sp. TaxID=1871183 RepID=UPI002D3FAF6D|nr:hypothetical protein [Kribbella sp.]HZX08011.1 hypothetical protein [Kribbella sp.]